MRFGFAAFFCAACVVIASASPLELRAQGDKIQWSSQEKPIVDQLRGLRKLPDDVRARTTKELAVQIRQLPSTAHKLRLADSLANLSTEGDFGQDTLQEVANTLAAALREQPAPEEKGQPAAPYVELAQLVRYEHVQISVEDPQFATAMKELEAEDRRRQDADFTLADLEGRSWRLKDLTGRVVLVNFWATWCPPCRKEMPDLEALYARFKDQGLVILAISDEESGKVKPFVAERKIAYPILLDPAGNPQDLHLRPHRQAGGGVDRHAKPETVSRNAGASGIRVTAPCDRLRSACSPALRLCTMTACSGSCRLGSPLPPRQNQERL